jgi:two-component system response regulator YesN
MVLYSIIIVEDEPTILKGLLETYDWNSMGFQVVASAKNGTEGLALARDLHPDIVVTDIMMKNMDGLELIRQCREICPTMHFVVISAYKEFDFAQKACALGAFAYLLKPIDDEQIAETMKSLHAAIEQEYSNRNLLSNYQKIFLEQQYAMETRDLKQYLMNNESVDYLENRLSIINSCISRDDGFFVVCLDINISDRILEQIDMDTKRFALSSHLLGNIKEITRCWCFELSDGRLVIIADMNDNAFSEADLRSCLAFAESALNLHVTASISHGGKGYEALKDSFMDAIGKFEMGSDTGASIISIDPCEKEPLHGSWYPTNIENEIIHAIRLNDDTLSEKSYARFTSVVFAGKDSTLAQLYCHQLALSILFFLRGTYGLTASIERVLCNYLKGVHDLKSFDAKSILGQAIAKIISVRSEQPGRVSSSQFDKYIGDSQRYIEQNLCRETLSVGDVSRYLHLNSVYFGRLFKSKTGKSFKEYLLDKRMEMAARILNVSEKSIIEVAQEVGIQSSSYFAQLFKQHTGVLPSNYKRKIKA